METAIPEKAAAPLVDRQWLTEPARAISQQFRADGQPARNPVSGVAIRPPAPGRDIAGTPIVPEAESSKGPLAARTVHAPEAQRPYAEPGVDALRSELPAVAEIPDAPLPSPALGAPLGNMRTSAQMKTSYGGVFYLINLGLFLGFYGDFTTPDEPGIELPIWDFIALIGRDLAGAAIEDDPVWSMLADLANRKLGEEPGAGYQNWFLEQTPKMRARLMLALGLESKDELGPLLLRHEATVLLTPTHLDIFFRLQDHPIEIRCSGLDRDPGWTPAAARYIAFHFE
jgi:hypothetical protein